MAQMIKSDYSQVEFIDIKDQYDAERKLECTFHIPELFAASNSDWVGIFRVGWLTIGDKMCSLNVHLPESYKSGNAHTSSLNFSECGNLSLESGEFYQFCYVTSSGLMRGMSKPWQSRAACSRHNSTSDDDFFEDVDDDGILIVRKRADLLKEENKELCRKLESAKSDFNSLTAKFGEKTSQLKAALKSNEQLKVQLEEHQQQLMTETKDMTTLHRALEEQLTKYKQECDLSNKKVEVQATFLRSGQDKIAQLLNAQDAYEGRLKQADSEKQLLKDQLSAAEEKARLYSVEVQKVKAEAEALRQRQHVGGARELQERDAVIADLRLELAEQRRLAGELVDNGEETRNLLEAANDAKALAQDEVTHLRQRLMQTESNLEMVQAQLAVTQSDLAMEAAEVKRLAGKIEQMKEERSSVVQRMALALQERNDEVNAKSEEIARLREMIDRREAESLAQGEEQAYEIARLREMIGRREAESLAQAEGPAVALRQAYEDLKNKLRREQETKKRTSAELAKLKSLACGEEWDEEHRCEGLRREVEDLKRRLRMSKEVYTAAVVECKTLRRQLRHANKVKGDKSSSSSSSSSNKVTDTDKADSAAAVAAPSVAAALAPPLVPITYKPTLRELAEKKVAAIKEAGKRLCPAVSADDDKFEDAVGEPAVPVVTPTAPAASLTMTYEEPEEVSTCAVCDFTFRGANASARRIAHVAEHHTGSKCPVCSHKFDSSFSVEFIQEHINRHFVE